MPLSHYLQGPEYYQPTMNRCGQPCQVQQIRKNLDIFELTLEKYIQDSQDKISLTNLFRISKITLEKKLSLLILILLPLKNSEFFSCLLTKVNFIFLKKTNL